MSERKYKILIADDEYWTREKIRHMIPWEQYSLEFLEPAVDGEDVLRRMERETPDILITDINMPFLNGVELLERVREKYPEVVFFVVSGYDDFRYVKSTFLSGAVNYLLKPVTRVELVNAVVRALEIISEREKEKLSLLKAASMIQDTEFSQMLSGQDTALIPSMSAEREMNLGGLGLILIKIHSLQEMLRQTSHDRNLFSHTVKKELRQLLEKEDAIVFNYIDRSNEFIIVADMLEKETLLFAEKALHYFAGYENSCITICRSGHTYPMESIHMAYVEAIGLLMTRPFCRKNEILLAQSRENTGDKVKLHFGSELEKQLRGFLMEGSREGVLDVILRKSGLEACEKKGWTYLEVKQTVRQIWNVLSDEALKGRKQFSLTDLEKMMELTEQTAERLDVFELCDVWRDAVEYLIPEKGINATDSMRQIVRQAAQWLDGHYFEEITLSELAERYHVESSYFSRMFRQEMGENLILYLTNRRIEKSKQYIRSSEMNLAEIAFMVGYDDYTYFSRVFKKATGISPREYRNQVAREKADLKNGGA